MILAERWFQADAPRREIQELAQDLVRSDPTLEDPRVQRMVDLVDRYHVVPGLPEQFYLQLADHALDGMPISHFDEVKLWRQAVSGIVPVQVMDTLSVLGHRYQDILGVVQILPHPEERHAWVYINSLRALREQWFKRDASRFAQAIAEKRSAQAEDIAEFQARYPHAEETLRGIWNDLREVTRLHRGAFDAQWRNFSSLTEQLRGLLIRYGRFLPESYRAFDELVLFHRDHVLPALRNLRGGVV